jgi:hypothetical protein
MRNSSLLNVRSEEFLTPQVRSEDSSLLKVRSEEFLTFHAKN